MRLLEVLIGLDVVLDLLPELALELLILLFQQEVLLFCMIVLPFVLAVLLADLRAAFTLPGLPGQRKVLFWGGHLQGCGVVVVSLFAPFPCARSARQCLHVSHRGREQPRLATRHGRVVLEV